MPEFNRIPDKCNYHWIQEPRKRKFDNDEYEPQRENPSTRTGGELNAAKLSGTESCGNKSFEAVPILNHRLGT